jgi:putative PIN family toxin of toxin-antitoxin system
MGEKSPALRVVLDTNTVVSALLFPRGQLGWMRPVWSEGGMLPLVSADTVRELIRVLAYPKFELDRADINATLSAYLPFIETLAVEGVPSNQPACRDPDDQMFVDLATVGEAEVLVSGDAALHEMAGQVPFAIETPAIFKTRFEHR